MSKPVITAEVMLVTPAMAKKWLEKVHPDQRAVSWGYVEALVNDILGDNWRPTHQGLAFDGEGLMIDGQHRCHAIVKANKSCYNFVANCPGAKFHDPIDRGRQRSVSTVTGLHCRVTGALALLHRMEIGMIHDNTPVTVAETLETMAHHAEAMKAIDGADMNSSRLVSGLRAAAVWTVPINQEKTVDFLQKVLTGEMIKRGEPAYQFRGWHERNRPKPMETLQAACNCLRAHLQDKKISSVFAADMGYRASCSKRRAMRVPHTPNTDMVLGVAWPIASRDKDEA